MLKHCILPFQLLKRRAIAVRYFVGQFRINVVLSCVVGSRHFFLLNVFWTFDEPLQAVLVSACSSRHRTVFQPSSERRQVEDCEERIDHFKFTYQYNCSVIKQSSLSVKKTKKGSGFNSLLNTEEYGASTQTESHIFHILQKTLFSLHFATAQSIAAKQYKTKCDNKISQVHFTSNFNVRLVKANNLVAFGVSGMNL